MSANAAGLAMPDTIVLSTLCPRSMAPLQAQGGAPHRVSARGDTLRSDRRRAGCHQHGVPVTPPLLQPHAPGRTAAARAVRPLQAHLNSNTAAMQTADHSSSVLLPTDVPCAAAAAAWM
jgi:hypothetical protein